jgi:AcrR family transcriptional regulator
VQLAWALPAGDAAQPEGLNPRKIVQAAIALADAIGLARLSMRQLGQQLGVSPMALYRHVRSREELVTLMVETALGPSPPPTAPHTDWPAALHRWGEALFARYEAHPWLLEVPAVGRPTTPNHNAWVERALAALARSGLPRREHLAATLLIDGHTRYIAHLRRHHPTPTVTGGEASPPRWLLPLLDPAIYPAFVAILAEEERVEGDGPTLTFGLSCIIAGLVAHARDAGSSA